MKKQSGSIASRKATVLMSGGLDSSACAHFLVQQGHLVQGIFVDFGQAAREPESIAVARVADLLGITATTLHVGSARGFGSGELVGRNAFLLMSAIFLGRTYEGLLAIGVHGGTPYYDCSAGFIDRLKALAEEYTDGRLTITAPFLHWTKSQIFEYATQSGLPVNTTYSCESGTIPPCGLCASCHDRGRLEC